MQKSISRRSFVAGAAAGSAAVASTALCAGMAVADEAGQGQAVPAWLGEPPVVNEADIVETLATDILVVGLGPAGVSCALKAAAEGGNVLAIDEADAGAGWRSSQVAAIGTRYQKAVGIEINKEDIINDIAHYALGQCDMGLIRNWADNSGEAADWLFGMIEEAGFGVNYEYNMPQEPTRYAMWPVGHGTVDATGAQAWEDDVYQALMARYVEFGGVLRTNTEMTSLIVEDGKVVGAYATNQDGAPIRIDVTKGVVLATGGYLLNPEMYLARQGELAKVLAGLLIPFPRTGDGIKAGIWAGGRLDDFPTTMLFDRGCVKPDQELGNPYAMAPFFHFDFGSQPFLKVSKNGTRIGNESAPYDFNPHGAQAQPGHAWYTIWDASWKEDVERFHTIGCSTLVPREGASQTAPGLDSVEAAMMGAVDDGYIQQADTLEELAQKLLISDVDAFVAEVKNYNRMYEAGFDDQYGKDAFRLSAIDEPPYFGMKQGAEPLCTLDGLVVNSKNQVLNDDNEPIEGLYAIGNDSGRFYCHTYPNFAAGLNAGRCITGGWTVAKQLTA